MKRYLTATFIVLSFAIIVFGLQIDIRWNGIISWGLAFICLIFATYFTKYIPDKKERKNRE